ncbi:helix-turn-helix transcriptional regulator [Nocardioides lijunqiniae]|uniref:helix-turn-helix transcriptional regulator n=1 Tax=Nocardioides lijunqiniae TaxID=2760832 RepID=UPI0018782FF4|nr:helix-turn-helix transcriptional regulator [Nocardioides lijunqiniae]
MQLSSPEMLAATIRRRGLSLADLARQSGCSKSMVGHLVTGHKTTCSPQLAARIATALDVPLELLFLVPAAPRPDDTDARPPHPHPEGRHHP